MLTEDKWIYDKEFIDNLLDDLFGFLSYEKTVLAWVNEVLNKFQAWSRSKIEDFDINTPYEHDKIDLANPNIHKWMNEYHDEGNVFSLAANFVGNLFNWAPRERGATVQKKDEYKLGKLFTDEDWFANSEEEKLMQEEHEGGESCEVRSEDFEENHWNKTFHFMHNPGMKES